MAANHSPRFLQIVDSVKPLIKECTIADLKQLQDAGADINLLDVREESEYAAGHIPGAVHLSKGVIERDIEMKFPDTTTRLYLYCGGGFRSALAARNLQEMGYEDVISVDGGFRVWKEAGYEVKK